LHPMCLMSAIFSLVEEIISEQKIIVNGSFISLKYPTEVYQT